MAARHRHATYYPRPRRYATHQFEQDRASEFTRSYNPGLGRTGRPASVPNGVVALDASNNVYYPWKMREEWKTNPTPAPRAATAMDQRLPMRTGYKHHKYGFLSAGRETKYEEPKPAAAWTDPDLPYLPAGLGYGDKHRHHFMFRSRDVAPRVTHAQTVDLNYRDQYNRYLATELHDQ